ncbi:NADP-dependent 3-hydroxy acid dehydrogenase YdfG [Gemmobacter megaterium]|uniref:NADP-dependent 3-hydroxy acid dehydrogenase YdfG n=1 Tax=Gemmobacter megaterium TaxID=1086013 RepID=A0A1N7PQC7_9RHOB|nr:SDR family NAD(P)-dependent oxidoreductase [Gemmobacter megaterium]GGE20628.1 short-chain dehydrogenase [Gemmobacter megaterium]SIT12796.1 NADP-dependent 3-hydroxy acid dehydrogenase YdfG [Gemmobacter megaterium]
MTDLTGKLVAITGAARGIGAAAARAFVAKGARVALISRDEARLKVQAAELGRAALAVPCDVADAAALKAALTQAEEAMGPLEVLINNAGVIDPIAHIADADPKAFARAVAVNLNGVFNGMHAALPGMIERGRGTILTIGSGAAHNPQEGWAAYCSSKAGAFMLTRAAHLEAGAAGVRVISLSPGTVATDMQAAIRTSGVNPVSQLDWSVHIPPEWPAQALVWMCGPGGDAYLGQEVSLRDEDVRRAVGVIQ